MTDRPLLEEPPEDPDQWSDEQWIAWLQATDEEPIDDATPARPATRQARVARSSRGQLLGAAMVGLHRAIYGASDEPAAVSQASSEPPDDQPFTLYLDPDHPEWSYALRRLWAQRSQSKDAGTT